ncbi:sporulation histidine kinase inhibitor Sda [Paenibacillus sp. 598K]|uniref:sporulation histidine kinase inhibitor Sda n=1 Tax=Paenibacillus sp. 598K TaxID=1117987 RepID=UPI0021AA1CCE|nr:sporulation histidine kinase inhibitor Sda [Paenibacillus sp. 598K]
MRISNPFLTMRNFIKSSEPYAPHAATASVDSSVRFIPERQVDATTAGFKDKTLLLKPLNDKHLLEVYREAKAMRLSDDFIRLIEHALDQRGILRQELQQQR